MRKVVNVISGKGGTGKTLLTAVLADMLGSQGANVLVIDLDIFVRGLTALLYFQKNGSLKIVESDKKTVSDFFKNRSDCTGPGKSTAISRYRCFDVLPSVASVNEILEFKDIMPNSIDDANKVLRSLLKSVPDEYDYIFLDSRAGYDELIAATHRISDFSICIEEDDDISMITSENLIKQLKNDNDHQVLRIRNKTRQIDSKSGSMGLTFAGNIPFDSDVMNSFGTSHFWDDISRSLYKEALAITWNSVAKKMGLGTYLPEGKRVSPLGSRNLERRLSIFPTINRIMFVYGIIITILSSLVAIGGTRLIRDMLEDPVRLSGVILSVLGLLLAITSVINNKKYKK